MWGGPRWGARGPGTRPKIGSGVFVRRPSPRTFRGKTKAPGHGPGDPVSCGGIRSNPTACARGVRLDGLLASAPHFLPDVATGVSRDPGLYSSRSGSRCIWWGRLSGRPPSAESCKDRSSWPSALFYVANDCGTAPRRRTRVFFAPPRTSVVQHHEADCSEGDRKRSGDGRRLVCDFRHKPFPTAPDRYGPIPGDRP